MKVMETSIIAHQFNIPEFKFAHRMGYVRGFIKLKKGSYVISDNGIWKPVKSHLAIHLLSHIEKLEKELEQIKQVKTSWNQLEPVGTETPSGDKYKK